MDRFKPVDVDERARKKTAYAQSNNSAIERCEACNRLKCRHTAEEVIECNRIRFMNETAGVAPKDSRRF